MERQKKYWLLGSIICVFLILVLIILFMNRGNNKTNMPMGAHGGVHEMGGNLNPNDEKIDNLNAYLQEQDTIMSDMMKAMQNVPKSGNASIDFLKGMIPHHESAIDMAESYLKHGAENKELIQIANAIVEAQTKEIDDMNAMIEKIEASGHKDEKKEEAYLKEYDKMNSSHAGHGNHSMPNSVDQAFADGMIMHHQMAIDMANAILDNSDEEDVKTLAKQIIETQKKEISEMQNILNSLR